MANDLIRTIPKKYRTTLSFLAIGLLLIIVLIAVFLQGRPIELWGVRIGPTQTNESGKTPNAGAPDTNVNQRTTGDNSPVIQGVGRDVNINIESKKDQKEKKDEK